MSETKDKFDEWAVVEIFGHQKFAGRVSEQAIGGCSFVRIDVPAIADRLPFTKLFGQGSIFSITPVSEVVARATAERITDRPVTIYSPTVQPRLPIPDDDQWVEDEDDDVEDDEQ